MQRVREERRVMQAEVGNEKRCRIWGLMPRHYTGMDFDAFKLPDTVNIRRVKPGERRVSTEEGVYEQMKGPPICNHS